MSFSKKRCNLLYTSSYSIVFQFDPENKLEEGDLGYNAAPELSDRVHVVVTVVPAAVVSLLTPDMIAKLRDIRLAATALGKVAVANFSVIHYLD